LTEEQRTQALSYVSKFRERPARPTGMETRARPPRIVSADRGRLSEGAKRYLADPRDPTVVSPPAMVMQRVRRIAREQAADALKMFEARVPGEKYVLYPIHFQPEASTLVQ